MSEKQDIFSSKIKYGGIFNFGDFYKFCYDFLTEELGFGIGENAYKEKVKGNTKDIAIDWEGESEVTDYFKYKIKVSFMVEQLENVEVQKDGKKISTNKGAVEVKIKGTFISDYGGKFDTSAMLKFYRGIYEKWIIPSKVEEYKGKLYGACDEFLGQAKAYLDIEGKK